MLQWIVMDDLLMMQVLRASFLQVLHSMAQPGHFINLLLLVGCLVLLEELCSLQTKGKMLGPYISGKILQVMKCQNRRSLGQEIMKRSATNHPIYVNVVRFQAMIPVEGQQ